MPKIRLLEEADDVVLHWREDSVAEAWRQWQLASCVEWNGGHLWVLVLEEPDDGRGYANLECEYCPAGVDDVFPDGQEFLHLDHGDVQVEYGEHSWPTERRIPVNVRVWTVHYNTPDANEWDAGLDLTVRD
jgi:hypothetical protein